MRSARPSSACRPSPSPTATRSPASSAPSTRCSELARAGAAVPRLLPAARLCLAEGLEVTALPRNRAGWARLCRLLTLGARRTTKGSCDLRLADLAEGATWPTSPSSSTCPPAATSAPGSPTPAPSPARIPTPTSPRARATTARTARASPAPPASPRASACRSSPRRSRSCTTAAAAGSSTSSPASAPAGASTPSAAPPCANAERRLRSEAEMLRLFAGHEEAVHRSGEIAEGCTFRLDELRYEYPKEIWEGEDPQARLERLTAQGPEVALPHGVPEKVARQAAHELALIGRLDYAPYFLTVSDVVDYARSQGILCQGRGSAANSVVCYALGITAVSPEIGTMVFERFVSDGPRRAARHRRRLRARAPRGGDPVHLQPLRPRPRRHLRHRHPLPRQAGDPRGRHAPWGSRATPSPRSPRQIWGWGGGEPAAERRQRARPRPDRPPARLTLELVDEIVGFPRHLSQHVGGFVITEGRLDELVPIENAAMEDRTVIAWDKDDIDALGILKVDVLALGMLTCIRKALRPPRRATPASRYTLATLPPEDPAVYDMLCRADTPRRLPGGEPGADELPAAAAAARRSTTSSSRWRSSGPGRSRATWCTPTCAGATRRGGGRLPLRRARRGARARRSACRSSRSRRCRSRSSAPASRPSEADRLRRAHRRPSRATAPSTPSASASSRAWRRTAIRREFAERCFSQIEGFGYYGFPESHAASFALLVYASAWLKCHHPAVFACALLNAQPMGFYAPAQIVRDARAHGVEVRPVCVNASYWDNALEPDGRGGLALRLGFRQIKGMRRGRGRLDRRRPRQRLPRRRRGLAAGGHAAAACWRGSPMPTPSPASASTGATALWQVAAIGGEAPLPLFDGHRGERTTSGRCRCRR